MRVSNNRRMVCGDFGAPAIPPHAIVRLSVEQFRSCTARPTMALEIQNWEAK